jgi:hypothetical protein
MTYHAQIQLDDKEIDEKNSQCIIDNDMQKYKYLIKEQMRKQDMHIKAQNFDETKHVKMLPHLPFL